MPDNEEGRRDVKDSHYLFVEIAAQRCAQLMHGAKPKIDSPSHKFTTLATREVEEGLVPWTVITEDEEIEEAADADGEQ